MALRVWQRSFTMPRPRAFQLHNDSPQWFHCISRVVDRSFRFGNREKDHFQQLLRRVETFSGVEVLTWTILSNHFHLVIRIPEPSTEPLSEETFWRRLEALYHPDEIASIRKTMRQIPIQTPGLAGQQLLEGYRQRFIQRMGNLSEFMKTLKQRFSRWFNHEHQRVGTLWESRFKSLVIEGANDPLMTVAAYIDLNAVRAGLVTDPADYPWSGYAEAVSGERSARCGLAKLFTSEQDFLAETPPWTHVQAEYARILYGICDREKADAPITSAPLRKRCRALTEGAALGSEPFIESFFNQRREAFGPNRRSGARKLHGGEWGDLRTLRDLKPRET